MLLSGNVGAKLVNLGTAEALLLGGIAGVLLLLIGYVVELFLRCLLTVVEHGCQSPLPQFASD